MKQKKRFAVILAAMLCIVCLAASFGITYAYLVGKDSADNSFTVGETATTIIEKFDPPKKLEPGISFKKEPTVKNVGNLPCYVRMRADFSDSNMKDLCENLDINTADWEYNSEDEYYYYKKLLLPGTDESTNTTSPLFTTVTLKTTKPGTETPLTDADMKDFDILIYAESKQHVDHEGDHPSDEYLTVWE